MTGPNGATPEQLRAIEIAREMSKAGIPVFVCRPNPYRPGKYFISAGWPDTVADPAALDAWEPGWGVAAVGGRVADWLDMDPRSGGIESQELLKNSNAWPLSFGKQSTPSGGTHDMISSAGVGKETGFLPGLDFQGGLPAPDEDGETHRAFVWLAPTVGKSKITGELVPYRWINEPDLAALDEWRAPDGTCTDESVRGVIDRVLAARSHRSASMQVSAVQTPAPMVSGDGGSSLFGRGGEEARVFTMEEAKAFVKPHLDALEVAPIGLINERGMAATLALEHFVPAFWSVGEATDLIMDCLSYTAYDPAGPSDWTADQQFIARLDGRRPARGSWKAKLATVAYLAPAPEAQVINTGRLRRAMLRRSEIHALPDPVPLIKDVLYQGSIAVLSGKFGTYKSFIAVSWAASLTSGQPWFGHAVPEAVPVIYAAAEGAYGIKRRLDAWESRYGPIPDSLYLIALPARINRPGDMLELRELVAETGAKVIIFDTLHASTPGVDENDSGQMGVVLDTLRTLQQEYGVTSVLPHHTGHAGERSRGSSSIEDDADTAFVVRLEGEDRGPANPRTLVHRKTKDAALIEPVRLHLEVVDECASAYVRPSDAFESSAGEERPADAGQERVISEPEEWTNTLAHHNAEIQRRILQTLRDVAGDVGRTESQVRKLVADRWHGGRLGRGQGRLDGGTFTRAWTTLRGKILDSGEPVLVSCGGERWSLNPIAIPPVVSE